MTMIIIMILMIITSSSSSSSSISLSLYIYIYIYVHIHTHVLFKGGMVAIASSTRAGGRSSLSLRLASLLISPRVRGVICPLVFLLHVFRLKFSSLRPPLGRIKYDKPQYMTTN